jgi:hypothetical protein
MHDVHACAPPPGGRARPRPRPRGALILAVAHGGAVLAASGAAHADAPSVDLRGWQAPVDPGAGTTLEPASAPDTGEWNAGVRMHWAYRPIELRSSAERGDVVPIEHQISADLVAGVGIAHRMLLGLDLPYVVAQTGDEVGDPGLRRALGARRAPLVAVGDLGLSAKLVLIRADEEELGGFGLAAIQRVSLPTGDETSFVGEGAATSSSRLLAEWRTAPVSALASAGARFRFEKERFLCGGLSSTVAAECPARFGHELPAALGLVVRPAGLGVDDGGRTSVHAELRSYVPLSPVAPFEEAEPAGAFASLAARLRVRDVSLFGGVEIGLTDGVGNAPVRVSLGVDFAPREHDVDGDGLEAEIDQCRELPEDADGFEDDDGCPEVDDDQDRVPDGEDRCPREAGPGTADGCPGAPPPLAAPAEAPRPALPPAGSPSAAASPSSAASSAAPPPGSPSATPPSTPPPPTGPRAPAGAPDDPDRDTLIGADDRCPAEAETFDGRTDDDGCPEARPANGEGPPLLAEIVTKDGQPVLTPRGPIAFDPAGAVTPASEPTLRAIASIARREPAARLLVGARPVAGRAELAQKRAFALAAALRGLVGRDDAVKVVDWDRVKDAPLAEVYGVGLVLAR